jgi:glycerol kinase
VLEATGFHTRDVVNAINADSGQRLTRMKVDGGMRKNWHLAARWEPDMQAARREQETRQWDRAVERAYGWSPP